MLRVLWDGMSESDFSQTNKCQITFINRNLGFFPTKTTKKEDENKHEQTRESWKPCALGGQQTRLSFERDLMVYQDNILIKYF